MFKEIREEKGFPEVMRESCKKDEVITVLDAESRSSRIKTEKILDVAI